MTTPFVPTSKRFPVQDPFLLERQLTNSYVDLAVAINQREVATYDKTQAPTGQKWFPTNNNILRDGNRIVLTFASILNGATVIPHHISYTYVTSLYGTANNGTTTIPLEHSTSTEVISLTMDSTNVTITTTTANWVAYSGTIVIEFI